MKTSVQYQSALINIDNKEILVDINEAKNYEGKFSCPYCHDEMFARCGQHNAKHFAHKRKECDYNNYLHTVAEMKMQRWIIGSEKIELSVPRKKACSASVTCGFYKRETCAFDSSNKINLKDYYYECKREERYTVGEKIIKPDLLLYPIDDKYKPIFIEINVTHPCEAEKIDSGFPIIEFDVKEEKDIDRIIGSTIRESCTVRFFNFKPIKDVVGEKLSKPVILQKFILFGSFKTYYDFHVLCRDVPSYLGYCKSYEKRRGILEITTYNDYDEQMHKEGGLKVIGIAYASQYFKSLKHCSICKNLIFDDEFERCRLLKERGSKFLFCKDASQCPDFQREEDIVNKRIDIFNNYRKTHNVDVWISDKIQIF